MDTKRYSDLVVIAIKKNVSLCENFEKKLDQGICPVEDVKGLLLLVKNYNSMFLEIYKEYEIKKAYMEQ